MNRQLVPIFLIVLVDVLGLMLIVPLLPLYAEHMGATPFIASLLFTSYAVSQLIAGPILGQISDRVGRKSVLIVSQIGTFLGFGLLAAANSLPLVFLSRVIDGLTAGNLSVAHAYIADVTQPKDRARAFGYLGVAFGIGFLIGPALAGFLAAYGPRWPIFAAMAASGVSIFATAALLPSKGAAPAVDAKEHRLLDARAFALVFRNRSLGLNCLQFVCFSLAFTGFFACFPLYAERRFTWNGAYFGVQQIGFVLAFMGLSAIPTQVFVLGPALRRFGERRLVSTGFLGVCAGFALLAVPRVTTLGVSILLLGVMSALLRPSLIGLITHHVSAREQGMIMGLVQSVMSLCQIVAPMVGGALIQHGWLAPWALIAAALMLAGGAISWKTAREGGRTG